MRIRNTRAGDKRVSLHMLHKMNILEFIVIRSKLFKL